MYHLAPKLPFQIRFVRSAVQTAIARALPAILLAFVAIAMLVSARAEAALNLPPPQELLRKASQDRRTLREALLDIQQNISEMRDPATFDSYFLLLSELEVLAVKTQLNAILPKAVEQTGLKMVAHGIRWLDLSQRPLSDALYYLRYADGDVMSRFVAETEIQVRSLKEDKRLRNIAVNLEGMLPTLEKKLEQRRDVRVSFRELLSSIAIRFLRQPNLNNQDASFWIAKISMPTAYSEYISSLADELLDSKPTDSVTLSRVSMRLQELGKKIAVETYPLPAYIASSWGDTALELILRSVQGERVFGKGEFENLIGMMRSRQLQGAAGQWLSMERLPSTKYASHYLEISSLLITKLRAVGLSKESGEVAKHIAQMAAPIQGAKTNLEGLYTLKAEDGSGFTFSVIRARSNLIYATLEMEQGYVTLGFFNVTYDVERQKYFASQREPDLDSTGNPTISFVVSEKGEIEVDAPIAATGWRKLKGKKTAEYTNFLDDQTANLNPTEGEWEGEMQFKSMVWNVRLVVSKFAGYSIGRLTSNQGVAIDFQTGTPGENGVIYLTTGKLPHSGWVHLRAIRRGDFLEGQMIAGAGTTVPYFKLKKVK